MKQKSIGVVVLLGLLIGILAVAPAADAEAPSEEGTSAQFELAPEEGEGKLIIVTNPSSLGPNAPVSAAEAVAAASQCGEGDQCAWSEKEQLSWWPGSDTGCHSHAGNPYLRWGVNNTPYKTRIGGRGYAAPGVTWYVEGSPVTGEICWPVP